MPGACQFGACETFYCGDGRITTPEQCEPGINGAPADPCRLTVTNGRPHVVIER